MAKLRYQMIRDHIRKDIEEHRFNPGDRLPSDADLAVQFEVSRLTVIRALRELEAHGYVQRKAGSGTFVCSPAAAATSSATMRVFGLLMPDLGDGEIFEPVARGIARAGETLHHRLLWGAEPATGRDKEQQAEELCRYFIARKVSGVFFSPVEHTPNQDSVNRRIVEAFAEAEIPMVLVDRCVSEYPDRSRYDLIGIDNVRAGFRMTRHLIEAGCRRIVFASRPGAAATVDARCAGYREAMWRSRLEPQPPFLVELDRDVTAEVRRFMDAVQPDGIVCANDFTAARVMHDLLKLGVAIPEKMKMVGVNDVKYARFLPVPLTTLRQPCQELGAAAMTAMLDRLRDPAAPPRDILLDCDLVIRQSCGTQPTTRTATR